MKIKSNHKYRLCDKQSLLGSISELSTKNFEEIVEMNQKSLGYDEYIVSRAQTLNGKSTNRGNPARKSQESVFSIMRTPE